MEKKVLDKYGIELCAGDTVCFIHKHSIESRYIVKAIVKEVKHFKPQEFSSPEDEGKGWVFIEKYVDDFMKWESKKPSKVKSDRVIKCY